MRQIDLKQITAANPVLVDVLVPVRKYVVVVKQARAASKGLPVVRLGMYQTAVVSVALDVNVATTADAARIVFQHNLLFLPSRIARPKEF